MPARRYHKCQTSDCGQPHYGRGLCKQHYMQWRRRNAPECLVEECDRASRARGLCKQHYMQWREDNAPACTIDGCDKPIMARELCGKHYQRWRMHGDPLYVKPPRANEDRFFSFVLFGSDGCWYWLGRKNVSGYGDFIMHTGNGRRSEHNSGKHLQHQLRAHRFAYQLWVGPIPEDYEIDHLCNHRACVNPTHLEAVTPSENRRRYSAFRRHQALEKAAAMGG